MEYADFGPDEQYSSRRLGPEDLGALQRLFERGSEYFRVATGADPAPDEASRAFVAGPPTRSVEDKRTIGLFDRAGELVGVIDALVDWPESPVWTVGMVLIDPRHRGRGLGTEAVQGFEGWVYRQGGRRIRTAVVSHHTEGMRFAKRAGYVAESTVEDYDAGARRASVQFFVKDLEAGGLER